MMWIMPRRTEAAKAPRSTLSPQRHAAGERHERGLRLGLGDAAHEGNRRAPLDTIDQDAAERGGMMSDGVGIEPHDPLAERRPGASRDRGGGVLRCVRPHLESPQQVADAAAARC